MLLKAVLLLLTVGVIACKSSNQPLSATVQEREVSLVQLETLVFAGNAIKAGSNHSGAVWIEISGGQVLIAKKGRPDFQEFVKKNAPKPIDFYLE